MCKNRLPTFTYTASCGYWLTLLITHFPLEFDSFSVTHKYRGHLVIDLSSMQELRLKEKVKCIEKHPAATLVITSFKPL